MLIQLIRYTFAPEHADRVAAIFKELQGLCRQEAGVVRFDVARGQDKPYVFVLWEQYRDEAALKAHAETEYFARLVVNGIRPLAKDRVAETVLPLE
jgi:quinol monooxygenase YgiN